MGRETALARKEAILLDLAIEISTDVVLEAHVPQMPLHVHALHLLVERSKKIAELTYLNVAQKLKMKQADAKA
jgi:hypothetical protein